MTVTRGRGEGSGIEHEGCSCDAVDISRRQGSLSGRLFQSKAEALEAVGLSEQDAHADS